MARNNTRFSVALHVLTYLAWSDEPASSWLLSTSVGTNPVVIRQLIRRLSDAGIVETTRGAKGGVRLARDPEEITLLEVHEAVDPTPPLPVHPPNRHCHFSRAARPGLESVLEEAETGFREKLAASTVSDALRSMTLQDETGTL